MKGKRQIIDTDSDSDEVLLVEEIRKPIKKTILPNISTVSSSDSTAKRNGSSSSSSSSSSFSSSRANIVAKEIKVSPSSTGTKSSNTIVPKKGSLVFTMNNPSNTLSIHTNISTTTKNSSSNRFTVPPPIALSSSSSSSSTSSSSSAYERVSLTQIPVRTSSTNDNTGTNKLVPRNTILTDDIEFESDYSSNTTGSMMRMMNTNSFFNSSSSSSSKTLEQSQSIPPVTTTTHWIDGSVPQRIEDIALHKKKLDEISLWLRQATDDCKQNTARIITEQRKQYNSIITAKTQSRLNQLSLSSTVPVDTMDDIDPDALIAFLDELDRQALQTTKSNPPPPFLPPSITPNVSNGNAIYWNTSTTMTGNSTLSAPPSRQNSIKSLTTVSDDGTSTTTPRSHTSNPRLLILMGPPGIGKSTAIHTIAASLGIYVREWIDPNARGIGSNGHMATSATVQISGTSGSRLSKVSRMENEDNDNGGDVGSAISVMYNNHRSILGDTFHTTMRSYSSSDRYRTGNTSLDEFQSFLGQGRLYKTLNLVGTGSTLSSSARPGTATNTTVPSSSSASRDTEILLIEDIPRSNSWTGDDHNFRTTLSRIFLSCLKSGSTSTPIVLCISEGDEAGDPVSRPSLCRLLGREVVDHPSTTVIEIPRTPPTRLRNVLQSILQTQGIPTVITVPNPHPSTNTDTNLSLVVKSADLIEDVIASCRGDLRHAIMSLQFACSAVRNNGRLFSHANKVTVQKTTRKKKDTAKPEKARPRNIEEDAGEASSRSSSVDLHRTESNGSLPENLLSSSSSTIYACGRDDFFDQLHSLGKLLYSKRDSHGKLENDPDTIMQGSVYDSSTTLAFLNENCVGWHTDIVELSKTLDAYATADALLGHDNGSVSFSNSTSRGTRTNLLNFPEYHSNAIMSRAISTFNAHPSPSIFRGIHRPRVFAVTRIAKANRQWINEEGLGLTFDLGLQNINQALQNNYLSSILMTDSKERCTHVIPTLGLLLNYHRKNQRYLTTPYTKSPYTSITPPVEALVGAACTYGSRIRYGSKASYEGVTSIIGEPIHKYTNMSTGVSNPDTEKKYKSTNDEQNDEMELVGNDVIRTVDEDQDNENIEDEDTNSSIQPNDTPVGLPIPLSTGESTTTPSVLSNAPSSLSHHPSTPFSSVSLAGLLTGMWEGTAALQGVNIGSYLQSSSSVLSLPPLFSFEGRGDTFFSIHSSVVQGRDSRGTTNSVHGIKHNSRNPNNDKDEDIEDFDN